MSTSSRCTRRCDRQAEWQEDKNDRRDVLIAKSIFLHTHIRHRCTVKSPPRCPFASAAHSHTPAVRRATRSTPMNPDPPCYHSTTAREPRPRAFDAPVRSLSRPSRAHTRHTRDVALQKFERKTCYVGICFYICTCEVHSTKVHKWRLTLNGILSESRIIALA
jgi:hypothetical protein